MEIRTAVILAAGLGARLKELGQSVPKGFLQLGDCPIIEESIEKLQQRGIQRVIIVTGHLSHYYQRLQERYAQQVITINNPRYAESGSMYSLYCARDLIDSDFLLLESDLIYEQRALEVVLAFRKDNVVLLSGETNAGDEVYVETDGETIVAMSKNRSKLGDSIAGEFVGITKVSRPLFQTMLDGVIPLFEHSLKVDYETDGLIAASKSYPVYYTIIPDLVWAEIDDEDHLLRARQMVYPTISGKPRPGENSVAVSTE